MTRSLVPPLSSIPSRRRFVQGLAAVGAASACWGPLARAAQAAPQLGVPVLTGDRFDLTLAPLPVNVTGRPRTATAINSSVPGPALRMREGDTVTINVTNRLSEPSSLHWHGILLPGNDRDVRRAAPRTAREGTLRLRSRIRRAFVRLE